MFVIDIENGGARRFGSAALEKNLFGAEIFVHGVVVVEMVAREVGEGGGAEAHAVDALLIERVARDLHAHALGTVRMQLRELAVHAHGIGRGVHSGGDLGRYAHSESSDVGGRPPAPLERLREQPRAGGLAVGAGDAGDRELLRRRVEEAVGDLQPNQAVVLSV